MTRGGAESGGVVTGTGFIERKKQKIYCAEGSRAMSARPSGKISLESR